MRSFYWVQRYQGHDCLAVYVDDAFVFPPEMHYSSEKYSEIPEAYRKNLYIGVWRVKQLKTEIQ